MKKILVIGAGRSSTSLINYLSKHSQKENWQIVVADMDIHLAKQKTVNLANTTAIQFDITNAEQREVEIKNCDIVVSMLPASMHLSVAKDCIKHKKHLATASYVSAEMQQLNEEAKKAGVILLNEMGLDPGIDHASAMKIIDKIHEEGGEVLLFKSYCGGLVAPESNDNPWGYKFSWNPRNVVLAGQGTAKYIEDGNYKFIPYNRLFTQIDKISVDGLGAFDGYANRDSLSYRKIYHLENIPTMLRGTLRNEGYCKAWNVFVKLGLTDDSYKIETKKLTYKKFLEAFLPKGNSSIKQKIIDLMQGDIDDEVMNKLEWLGILEDKPIELNEATPAQILQDLLEKKWVLKPNDKDMVVMQHVFEYKKSDKKYQIISSLVVKGENQINTAMAQTVGLPLGIAVKNILQNKINSNGVIIPVTKEIYNPVLNELEDCGITFTEKQIELKS